MPGIKPPFLDHPACTLVTIPTTLSWLICGYLKTVKIIPFRQENILFQSSTWNSSFLCTVNSVHFYVTSGLCMLHSFVPKKKMDMQCGTYVPSVPWCHATVCSLVLSSFLSRETITFIEKSIYDMCTNNETWISWMCHFSTICDQCSKLIICGHVHLIKF